MTLRSILVSGRRPLFTAACTASIAASGLAGMSSTSAPASRARTEASPAAEAVHDPSHVESVRYDDSLKSKFVAQNAGQDLRRKRGGQTGVIEGRHRDVGGHDGIHSARDRSAERRPFHRFEVWTIRRDRSEFMCVSVAVSPWPGKCFAVTRTRFPELACAPSMNALTKRDTLAGFSPYDRILMMGLSGLLFTSASGKNSHWKPIARDSFAVISPSMRASSGSPDAVKAMACGKHRSAFNAHGDAALEVSPDQKRNLRHTLHAVDERGGFAGGRFAHDASLGRVDQVMPPTCSREMSCETEWHRASGARGAH